MTHIYAYHMSNALPEVLAAQRAVFDRLSIPLRQVCSALSHGQFLTETLRNADVADVVVFFDIDCIPLRADVVERVINVAQRRRAIVGCAQQANHLEALKYLSWYGRSPYRVRAMEWLRCRWRAVVGVPNPPYVDPLTYAAPCFLVVPVDLYRQAGQPSLEESYEEYLDVGARLTVCALSRGIRVVTIGPTHSQRLKYRIGDRLGFGLGTTYGRGLLYHAFESTYVKGSQTPQLFLERCEAVLSGKMHEVH